MSMRFTAAVSREQSLYVAQCLEVDVASQGATVDESLANLKEALLLHFEEGNTEVRPSPLIASLDVDVPAAE